MFNVFPRDINGGESEEGTSELEDNLHNQPAAPWLDICQWALGHLRFRYSVNAFLSLDDF